MEGIKEVKSLAKAPQAASQSSADATPAKQVSSRSLSAGSATVQLSSSESVKVQISSEGKSGEAKKSPESTERTLKFNKAISAVADSSERVGQVAELVQSLGGIANQALEATDGSSEQANRRSALQNEAESLLDEIKTKIDRPSGEAANPLRGESIEVDLGEKQVSVDFSQESTSIVALAGVDFSTREAIQQTLTKVEDARSGIERLSEKLQETEEQFRNAVSSVDVEAANGESALSKVDDVESAARLANDIAQRVASDGDSDKGAFANSLSADSLRLLQE